MKKGFTLVELLVVMAIIGILAAASYAVINPAAQMGKARDSKRKAELAQIRAALELYRADNGTYPVSGWMSSSQGDSWIPGLNPNYLKSIPRDPKPSGSWPWQSGEYAYAYISSGTVNATNCGIQGGVSYILTTRLENANDPEINNTITYGTCSWPAVSGYTNTSTYSVTSP